MAEAGAIDGYLDQAEDRSAEGVNHIGVGASGGGHLVDRHNPVVRLYAGEVGGTVRRDRGDPKFLVRRIERDPNSAEPVAGGALIASDFGRRVAGEAVESGGDAIEQRLVDLVVGKRRDTGRDGLCPGDQPAQQSPPTMRVVVRGYRVDSHLGPGIGQHQQGLIRPGSL